ncbi:MAG: hypothetical protein J7M26_00480, partial [Armatimonadetes bacterium]|nr:hypothetical protein [Armatimonadota bacterium]
MLSLLLAVCSVQLSSWSWEPLPTWLANPARSARVEFRDGLWRFEISEPGCGMKWRKDRGEPLLIEPGFFVVIEYRASQVAPATDYAFWVESGGRGINLLPLNKLQSDGRWHVIAFDADALGLGGLPATFAVQVQAGPRVPARLEVRRIEVVLSPPAGATVLPKTESAAKPWRWDCDSAEGFRARVDWLGNPSDRATLSAREGVVRLAVPEAGLGMKWSWRLPTPVDLTGLHYATLRYRARGLADHGDYFVFFGSEAGGMPARNEMPVRIRDLVD